MLVQLLHFQEPILALHGTSRRQTASSNAMEFDQAAQVIVCMVLYGKMT